MNIIIEGPDGTGKTTLAKCLLQTLHHSFQVSAGPPGYPGEMEGRARRYLSMTNTLFDRHPCIGEPIYSQFRNQPCGVPKDLINQIYGDHHLIIYCVPTETQFEHQVKDYDSGDHLKMIDDNHNAIVKLYHDWSLVRANLFYTIGDDTHYLLTRIQKRMDNYD